MNSFGPKILGPDHHDFHDSSLEKIEFSESLDKLIIIVSNFFAGGNQKYWKITFSGLLRFDFETVGIGGGEKYPIEIYDIYEFPESPEKLRWYGRLQFLGISEKNLNNLHHIVLASSHFRGWGRNEEIEGLNIICRNYEINQI